MTEEVDKLAKELLSGEISHSLTDYKDAIQALVDKAVVAARIDELERLATSTDHDGRDAVEELEIENRLSKLKAIMEIKE